MKAELGGKRKLQAGNVKKKKKQRAFFPNCDVTFFIFYVKKSDVKLYTYKRKMDHERSLEHVNVQIQTQVTHTRIFTNRYIYVPISILCICSLNIHIHTYLHMCMHRHAQKSSLIMQVTSSSFATRVRIFSRHTSRADMERSAGRR